MSIVDDSLASSAMGESILNRMYELTANAGEGHLSQPEFEKKLGPELAGLLNNLGITGVEIRDTRSTVTLKKQLKFGDENGQVEVGQTVDPTKPDGPAEFSFTAKIYGGAAAMENIKGITASNALGSADVRSIDLQPRKDGYLSASLNTSWTDVNLCALPNGKILH